MHAGNIVVSIGHFKLQSVLYDKSPLSIDQQIERLKERGLEIKNEEVAKKYLSHISDYRLAGYWWSMQEDESNHKFKTNSTFEKVSHILHLMF